MNFKGLFWRALRLWQKLTQVIEKVKKEWEKEEWKQYKCGNYTDIDENHCPSCGMETEPSKIVKVRKWKLRRLVKKGKVWTKHVAGWERRLSQ